MPATPAEVDPFVSDTDPGAYERLIDRILSSFQYGERWGRHWLDVAGYADSEGYTEDDPVRPWAEFSISFARSRAISTLACSASLARFPIETKP